MTLYVPHDDESRFYESCFYERRPLRTDATSVMAVHHNYISGDDRKFERARAYHAIVDENDKTWEAFARRSRAAMQANASWSPADAVGRNPNPAVGEARVLRPSAKGAIRSREQCGSQHDASFEAKWSPLRRQCHTRHAPQSKPFCRSRLPPALWAVNGAGADWLRVVLELSTGYSTGSVIEDRALAALLPSEKWPSETPEECVSMLVIATTGSVGLHGSPWTQIACGGAVTRAIFLIRHPFAAAWASWDPQSRGNPGLVPLFLWPGYVWQRMHDWAYLVDYATGNARVDTAYRVWMRERGEHVLVRLEDLLEGDRAEFELRRVLDFVLNGQYHLASHVARCALAEATATLRATRGSPKEEECVDVHGGAGSSFLLPTCCAQCAMRRAFERSFNHGRGPSAMRSKRLTGRRINQSVGDAAWDLVAGTAPKFGYTRHGYTALGPHVRPSFGAQSSAVQLLECNCPAH